MANKAKKLTALLCALTIAVTCCGCGREIITGESTEAEKTLSEAKKAASDGKFSLFYNAGYSLNPMKATDVNNQLVCGLVYENMVTVDNGFDLKPGIVTAWKSDNGTDWSFDVDTTKVFSDGTKLTAKDVAYSLKMAINNDRYENRFNGIIAGISTKDETTFTVKLNRADMQFPCLLTVPVIRYNTVQNNHPVGTGPYVFAEDNVSLVKSEKYSGTLPVDAVYLVEYDSVEDFITKFEDSTVDLVINDPSTSSNLGFGSANETRSFNTTNFHYIVFNKESTLFASGELQYAMSYAFDRDYMANTLLQGNALAACEPISPASYLYNKYFDQTYGYDLDECRNVLTNIGVDDYDADGKAEFMRSGTPIEMDIDFVVCSDSGAKVSMAEKFAEDMAAMGITVNVKKLGWDEYRYALSTGGFDMAYCEVKLSPNFDLTSILADNGANNYSRGKDNGCAAMINAYLASSAADRQKCCDQMCDQIAKTAAIIPICFEKHQVITHKGVMSGMSVNQNDPMNNFSGWKIDI